MRLLLGALGLGDQASGRSRSRAMPFCSGPRQYDQLPAPASGVQARNTSNSDRQVLMVSSRPGEGSSLGRPQVVLLRCPGLVPGSLTLASTPGPGTLF